jgi:hypothetical protein
LPPRGGGTCGALRFGGLDSEAFVPGLASVGLPHLHTLEVVPEAGLLEARLSRELCRALVRPAFAGLLDLRLDGRLGAEQVGILGSGGLERLLRLSVSCGSARVNPEAAAALAASSLGQRVVSLEAPGHSRAARRPRVQLAERPSDLTAA